MSLEYKNLWKFVIVKSVMILLFGCATVPEVYIRPPLSASSIIDPAHGLVAVRIIDATGASVPINYVTLIPSNVNESEEVKPIRLEYLGEPNGSSTLFYSSIPPGQYSIGNLRSYHSAENLWYDRWFPANLEMGVFEVKSGELTDLGSLIYYAQPQGENMLQRVLRSPESSMRDTLTSFVNGVDIPVASNSWSEDESEDQRRSLYLSAVQNPIAYNEYYIAEDQSAYFVGKLGFIMKRNAAGEWSEDAVDVDTDLTSITVNSRGALLVGGEFGALFYKASENGDWLDVSLDPRLLVQSIEFVGEDEVEIIVWSLSELKVLRANLADLKNARIIASYKPEFGWFDELGELVESTKVHSKKGVWEKRISAVFTSEFKKKNVISISSKRTKSKTKRYSIFNPISRNAFRFYRDSWEVEETKGFGGGVDFVMNAGSEKIGVLFPFISSINAKSRYVVYDPVDNQWVKIKTKINLCPELPYGTLQCDLFGRERSKIQHFSILSAPKFLNKKNAFVFGKIELNVPGLITVEKTLLKLLKTNDGGKNWEVVSDAVPGGFCTKIIPEIDGGLLVSCKGISGDFYFSKDFGMTWDHVRQHENF